MKDTEQAQTQTHQSESKRNGGTLYTVKEWTDSLRVVQMPLPMVDAFL